MNAALWPASADPKPMLDYLLERRLIADRKLRLWCAALFSLSKAVYNDWNDRLSTWLVGDKANSEGSHDSKLIALSWVNPKRDRPGDPPMALRAEILRDLVGDPFAPVRLDDAYRTPLVVNLAQAAFDEVASGTWLDSFRLLVLADVLEEVGVTAGGCIHCAYGDYINLNLPCACMHREILSHLRWRSPHFRGCWAVDLILGKE